MIGERSAPRHVGFLPILLLRGAFRFIQQNATAPHIIQNKIFSFLSFIFLFFDESVRDTRSAWRYCNTRATLGQGAAQAPQDPSHGLNNSLKLM